MVWNCLGSLLFNKAVYVSVIAVGIVQTACSSDAILPQSPDQTIQATSSGRAALALTGTPRDDFRDGSDLYIANCQVCHGDRNGFGGNDVAPPHNEKGHTWHHPDAQLREWVTKGKLGFGGPAMPAFEDKLSEREVDAILTFFKSWWDADQRESQADISQRYQEALEKQRNSQ